MPPFFFITPIMQTISDWFPNVTILSCPYPATLFFQFFRFFHANDFIEMNKWMMQNQNWLQISLIKIMQMKPLNTKNNGKNHKSTPISESYLLSVNQNRFTRCTRSTFFYFPSFWLNQPKPRLNLWTKNRSNNQKLSQHNAFCELQKPCL